VAVLVVEAELVGRGAVRARLVVFVVAAQRLVVGDARVERLAAGERRLERGSLRGDFGVLERQRPPVQVVAALAGLAALGFGGQFEGTYGAGFARGRAAGYLRSWRWDE